MSKYNNDHEAVYSRRYRNEHYDSAQIANDVVLHDTSSGWQAFTQEEMCNARKIEVILAKYNIGYVDDMFGAWGYVEGGSEHFK